MKARRDSNQKCIGGDIELFTNRRASGCVRFDLLKVKTIRDNLELLSIIAEGFVSAQRCFRAAHDARCEFPREQSTGAIDQYGAPLIMARIEYIVVDTPNNWNAACHT